MKEFILSEKTPVRIGLVVTISIVVIWAVRLEGRVTAGEANAAENKSEIHDIKSDYLGQLRNIDQRLSRIEGAVGAKADGE